MEDFNGLLTNVGIHGFEYWAEREQSGPGIYVSVDLKGDLFGGVFEISRKEIYLTSPLATLLQDFQCEPGVSGLLEFLGVNTVKSHVTGSLEGYLSEVDDADEDLDEFFVEIFQKVNKKFPEKAKDFYQKLRDMLPSLEEYEEKDPLDY